MGEAETTIKKYVLFPKSGYVYYLAVEPIPSRPDWFLLAAEKRIVVSGIDAFDTPEPAWRALIATQEAAVREAERELGHIRERQRKNLVQDPDA